MDEQIDAPLEESGEQAPPASPPAGEADKGKANEEVTQLRERLTRAEQTNRELDEQGRQYREELRTRVAPAASEPAPVEEEDESPEAFVDSLAAQGPKAIAKLFEKYAKKHGLVTTKEAEAIADKKTAGVAAAVRNSIAADSDLFGAHPELKDKTSEIYKATGEVFREMCEADPALKNSPAALKIAARTAKAELASKNGGSASDREAERVRRIDAQQGDRGRGRAESGESEDDSVTAQDRTVAAAMGVSDAAFVSERKKLRAAQ